jgi:hypothetical protein
MLSLIEWFQSDRRANELNRLGVPEIHVVAAVIAFALSIIWASPSQANCQDLLGNRTFECVVKDDDGDQFDDCFTFTTPGEQSEDFDLFSADLSGVLSCDCKATGKFSAPNFGESNSFHCATTSESGLGLAFDSKIKRRGRRLLGEAVSETGTSFMFRCDRARTCELPAPAQRARAPSW